MREEDLIPAFVSCLEDQKPLHRSDRKLLREINARMEVEDYFESEEATYDLESLFDALNDYTMPGFYFGSHPGDGSDYGFWLDESFAEDFDGIKVENTSEVPRGYTGAVLHCNDHGNLTLYTASRGRLHEVWAIV
jgi:hypothetical protein